MAKDATKQHSFEIRFPPKGPITCMSTIPSTSTLDPAETPPLIFTHGASGTITSPAMQNFTSGFAPVYPIITFNGPMNLPARTAQFGAILASHGMQDANSLGGRSMGARGAVNAATAGTTHLVLASYPLQAGDKVRDQILLDIPEGIKVVFVSGDRDGMCDLLKLAAVRQRMKAKTWMLTVRDADHGMAVKPKKATDEVGRLVGDVVARWLLESNEESTEGEVFWDVATGKASWTGWSALKGSKAAASSSSKKRKAESAPAADNTASASKLKSAPKRRKADNASTSTANPPKNTKKATRNKAKK